MLPFRAVAPTVLASSILWVGTAAVGTWLTYSAVLPSPVVALLLPPSVPIRPWFGPVSEALITALIAGTVHAAVLALVLRVVVRRDGSRLIPIWFAVVLTSFVAAGLLAAASLFGDSSAVGLRFLAGQTAELTTEAGLWGVVWGWLPTLIGTRLAGGATATRPRIALLAPAVLAVAATVVAVQVLPGLGRQQPVVVAAPQPSPSITHYGWARIDPVSDGSAPRPGACDSEDVTVTVGTGDAATGHRSLGIRAVNTGDRACRLQGYPDVVFDDAEGDAMQVLVVHGGSFMTTDAGARSVRLRPGDAAVAQLGWNAQSAAGEQRAGKLFVSIRPGTTRLPSPVDLDIKDGGSVAVTAWKAFGAQ